MQLVLEQALSQSPLYLALSGCRLLPAGKSHLTHDVVDIGNDSLDDHWSLCALYCFKQLRERRLPSVLLLGLRNLPLRFDHVLGQDKKALEEVDRGEDTLLVLYAEIF